MKVAELREKMGMPRSIFCREVGASEMTIARWEKGDLAIDHTGINYRFRLRLQKLAKRLAN